MNEDIFWSFDERHDIFAYGSALVFLGDLSNNISYFVLHVYKIFMRILPLRWQWGSVGLNLCANIPSCSNFQGLFIFIYISNSSSLR